MLRALDRRQRWLAVPALTGLARLTHSGVLVVLAAACGHRAWARRQEPASGDGTVLAQWLTGAAALAAPAELLVAVSS